MALVITLLACGIALPGLAAGELTTGAASIPRLASVVIQGSSVYGPPRLFGAYRDALGREISRESARAVSDALIAMYEADGYVRPDVEFDDSLTGRGVLRLQIHEAQLSRVIVEGDAGRIQRELERAAARLEQAKPLRRDDIPKALRELRQMAGVSVSASTRRDPAVRNAFELVLKAKFSAVDGVVRMNNRGTEQVGPAIVQGQLFANGLMGRQGKVGLIFASAMDHEEYLGGGLYFDVATPGGSRISTMLFQSRSAPNESPRNLDDVYDRGRATLRVWRPLRNEGGSSLSMSIALDAEDLMIDRNGSALREERLRVLEGGLRAGWRGEGATQFSANLQLRRGLDALGAGLQAADIIHDPRRVDFLVTQAGGSVYRRFATDWSWRGDALGQYSAHVLPDSERFKIGGDRLGRGFEVAEIAGDSGIGGKIELRRDLMNSDGLLGRLSAYGFYDFGAAWKQDHPGRQSATTAGTGVSIQGATLSGYLEVAAPLTGADVEGKREPSLFAEISYRF